MDIKTQKQLFRKKIKEVLKELHGVRHFLDNRIRHQVLAQHAVRKARVIMGYFPLNSEIDLFPLYLQLLSCGKRLTFPRVEADQDRMTARCVYNLSSQSATGAFGVREPYACLPQLPKTKLDIILVPGLAFTETGQRLGRGGGYYDRFLDGYTGTRLAACYDEQLVPTIPQDTHDQKVDLIVTPKRVIRAAIDRMS